MENVKAADVRIGLKIRVQINPFGDEYVAGEITKILKVEKSFTKVEIVLENGKTKTIMVLGKGRKDVVYA